MRATVGVWGAQALMRRIPPFLFICLREPWERVKICLLPKLKLWIMLRIKTRDLPSLVLFLSVVSPFFSIGHIRASRHMSTSFLPTRLLHNDDPARPTSEGSVWARNLPMGRTRAHKRLEMVSPYESTLFSILCFSGHPLSYRS